MALMGTPHDASAGARVTFCRADAVRVPLVTTDTEQKTLFLSDPHSEESACLPLERGSMAVAPMPGLHTDFGALLARFKADDEYRKMVRVQRTGKECLRGRLHGSGLMKHCGHGGVTCVAFAT
jgi:hypothetical protein